MKRFIFSIYWWINYYCHIVHKFPFVKRKGQESTKDLSKCNDRTSGKANPQVWLYYVDVSVFNHCKKYISNEISNDNVWNLNSTTKLVWFTALHSKLDVVRILTKFSVMVNKWQRFPAIFTVISMNLNIISKKSYKLYVLSLWTFLRIYLTYAV